MNDIATGVYQLDNGFWGYRYTYMVNGKKKDISSFPKKPLPKTSLFPTHLMMTESCSMCSTLTPMPVSTATI